MNPKSPSHNGANGRDTGGKFAKGNPGGPGNPLAKRVNKIRATLLQRITADDFAEIVAKLIALAKAGDMTAIREVLDRSIGKSVSFVDMRNVERNVEWKRKYPLPWEGSEDE